MICQAKPCLHLELDTKVQKKERLSSNVAPSIFIKLRKTSNLFEYFFLVSGEFKAYRKREYGLWIVCCDGSFNSTVIEDIYIKESGPKKRFIIEVDRVGFEPTTTHVSSANMHARQVFYQAKLPALLKY